MPNITTCPECGKAYEASSEENAGDRNRMCGECARQADSLTLRCVTKNARRFVTGLFGEALGQNELPAKPIELAATDDALFAKGEWRVKQARKARKLLRRAQQAMRESGDSICVRIAFPAAARLLQQPRLDSLRCARLAALEAIAAIDSIIIDEETP